MSSKIQDFLQRVLPAEGYKCATIFSNGFPRNEFAKNFEDLERIITFADARGDSAYHACASFKLAEHDSKETPPNERTKGRTQHNVLGAKSFWLDIDAGEGKAYQDAFAAAEACNSFIRHYGLPVPIYVGSGNGLHIYWPLEKIVGVEEWRSYASGLKRLCSDYGLHADGVRTADISSILRTPGTHNRKHGEKVVRCSELTGPYPLSDFGVFNGHNATIRQNHFAAPVNKAPKEGSLVSAAIKIYGEDQSFTAPVVEGCAQVRALRDKQGIMPEPEWYAALGVLAYCADGEEYAHAWSQGYKGYTFEETQTRLERQKDFGPTTCEKFYGLNPQRCEGCPFRGKITSPIQLGRANIIEQVNPPVDQLQRNVAAPVTQGPGRISPPDGFFVPVASPPVVAPNLPQGFAWRDDSLFCNSETRGGKESFILISQTRLYMHGVQTGETNADRFSLLFKLKLPQEKEKEIVIRARDFFGQQGISIMADSGAVIHEPDLFRRYVRGAIDMWHVEHRLEKRYDQFGWKNEDNAFLFGKKLYTATAVIDVIGSREIEQRSQWLRPRAGGSLENWSQAANSLFAEGCEPQSLALLCSFAAPIMRFHATDEGGAIVSLLSRASGSGKTTALAAVASVWGLNKGLSLTNIDTKVSKGLTLAALGNLPVVYDELTDKDPTKIREFVLVFTSGRDKMRGTQEGEIRHTESSWQTLLVSGSNRSLVDFLTTKGVDALGYRVMEFNTQLPAGLHKRGDALRKELEANAGFAGDVYLRALLQPSVLAWVKMAVPAYTQQIWERTGLQSQHRFWVRTLASVAVAGAIVNKLGLLSFSPQRILDWAIDEVTQRKDDTAVTTEGNAALNALGEFLNEHIADMLVMPGPYVPKQRSVPVLRTMRRLLIRYELEGKKLLITDSVFREWLVKNEYSPRVVIAELARKLVISRKRTRATLGAGTEYASGQIDCVEVNGSHPALSGMLASVSELAEEKPPSSLRGV